jgi:hypothetical protein
MKLKNYIMNIEEKIDNIPGIMDRTSEAECVQEVINYALTYLDPFCDMSKFDTDIVKSYVTQTFNEYWSLV